MGLFKVRRTTTPGLIPAGLTYGEMAVNLADRILYVGGTAENAIEIAGGSGNYRFYYQADAPGLSQGYGITGETGQYDYLVGSRWIDSDTGREYVYIGDGDQWYWVEPPGGGGGAEGTWIRPDATTATDIAGIPAGTTGLVGETSIQILERILYPYQSVSFSNLNAQLGATQFELGQTAGNGSKTVTWTASAPSSNWIAGSGVLRYSGFVTGTLATGFNPTANSATVTYPALRATNLSSNTLTLQITGAQEEGTNPSTTTSVPWWSKMYWGKSTNTALTNQTLLTAGSERLVTSTGSQTPISTTDALGYLYIFLHSNYSISSLTLSGFDVLLNTPVTTNITNGQGLSVSYKIYRSTEELPGPIPPMSLSIS